MNKDKSHARTVANIRRYRTRKLAGLITKAYLLHRRRKDEQMYNLICEEFMTMGGVYVKFLQGVLLRSQVMRRWHNPDKLKIFENLDSEPLSIATLLQAELPKDKLSQIALVQPQPFAAGSFGQVYYAQHRDGRAIIIKVLRPMVRELLQHDLKLLATFSRTFFVKLYKNMDIQLNQALKEFRDATLRETDYRHEAAFANELYQTYKNHPYMVIPETFLDLCTDNIIVQEYVDGISVAQLVRMQEQGVIPGDYVREQLGSDLDFQLETVGYESIMGIFTLPRVQGDPHPGNIRVMRDNKVGLIDFGISAKAPEDKSAYFGLLESYDRLFKGNSSALDLFEQGLRFFVGDLYKSLNKLGKLFGNQSADTYSRQISEVAEETFEEMTGSKFVLNDMRGDQSILMVINKLVNKGNRFGLVMKLESTEILRATQTYTTLVASLGRYNEVVPKIMDRVVRDARARFPEISASGDDQIGINDALETVTNWLERVADRDPALFNRLLKRINVARKAKNAPEATDPLPSTPVPENDVQSNQIPLEEAANHA